MTRRVKCVSFSCSINVSCPTSTWPHLFLCICTRTEGQGVRELTERLERLEQRQWLSKYSVTPAGHVGQLLLQQARVVSLQDLLPAVQTAVPSGLLDDVGAWGEYQHENEVQVCFQPYMASTHTYCWAHACRPQQSLLRMQAATFKTAKLICSSTAAAHAVLDSSVRNYYTNPIAKIDIALSASEQVNMCAQPRCSCPYCITALPLASFTQSAGVAPDSDDLALICSGCGPRWWRVWSSRRSCMAPSILKPSAR
jgi:hypothetical protein